METRSPRSNRLPRIAAAFIVVQIALPLLLLGTRWGIEGSHPIREYPLSWQMYSAADTGKYVGETASGEEMTVDTEELPMVVRSAAYDDAVQTMLCERNPELASVRREGGRDELPEEEVKC